MKVLLCVLDGFGHGPAYKGNAIANARTPFLDELYSTCSWTLLKASGEDVGIPKGTQGGSEVGHLTMGAGRIVLQPLQEIDHAIADGHFFKKQALLDAAAHARTQDSAFHILGMISDQGIHADLDHALALLDFAKEQGLKNVYVHGILDGRDVPPKSAKIFIQRLQAHMEKIGIGKLASLVGRYYAMDRDKNWDRTEVAYELYAKGTVSAAGLTLACRQDPLQAIDEAYASGIESDYYISPILLGDSLEDARAGLMKTNDALVFFNFRTDRAAQLTERFLTPKSPDEPTVFLTVFGPYATHAPVVFPETKLKNNLGAVIEAAGLSQLRIAETEKYAHVTFFFNSQAKEAFAHEKRIMVDSPKCPSYAEKPEMSAQGITDALKHELKTTDPPAFIALNFANLDLVGHSGHYEATVEAVETIDRCLAQFVPLARSQGYAVLLTGDHGNAEYMIYDHSINPIDEAQLDGSPCPSHTRNPVPFLFIPPREGRLAQLKISSHEVATGGLQDVAPTVLALLGLEKPSEMTGSSLVE